jgi:hypothetical protein
VISEVKVRAVGQANPDATITKSARSHWRALFSRCDGKKARTRSPEREPATVWARDTRGRSARIRPAGALHAGPEVLVQQVQNGGDRNGRHEALYYAQSRKVVMFANRNGFLYERDGVG